MVERAFRLFNPSRPQLDRNPFGWRKIIRACRARHILAATGRPILRF